MDNIFRLQEETENTSALTDSEIETILLSLAESRGIEGFEEEEADKVLRWANQAAVDASLLKMTLQGLLYINWSKDENTVSFGLTPTGAEFTKGMEN